MSRYKILVVVILLIITLPAISSEDPSSDLQLPDPPTNIQSVNMTENDEQVQEGKNMTEGESSGDTDSLNCTCTDIICSNCGLVYNLTNLLPDVTTIQFFEEIESANGEGKKYLEVHFCQLIGLRIVISNIGVSEQ